MSSLSEKSNQPHAIKMTETVIRIRDHKAPLLQGKYSSLIIRNYKDVKNSNSTTATFYDKNFKTALVLTADATIQVIGQRNYDVLFNNLIKSRDFAAIVSLLTVPKLTTVWAKKPIKLIQSTQPSAQHINKSIMLLEDLSKRLKCDSVDGLLSKVEHLIDQSKKKDIISVPIKCNCKKTPPSTQPTHIKNNLDGAENVVIQAMDGSNIILPFKPKDLFHIATPEITENYTTKEEKYKLQCLQAVFDWKLCTKANEEGYLPIHIAASENDVDLIKRHGTMLKAKGVSIDIVKDMTALQMAITSNETSEATECLLKLGANVTQKNDKEQNLLHFAATSPVEHMKAIIRFMNESTARHRDGKHDAGDLSDSHSEDVKALLSTMALATDIYGDTPLMLACRSGNVLSMQLLIEIEPDSLYTKNPSSGNTVLHVAMTTALKHFEYLSNNMVPCAKMLLKTEEILSTLVRLIKMCNTQIKNFNNLTPVDLINQTSSNFLVAFVADQLNSKNSRKHMPKNNTRTYLNPKSSASYTVNKAKQADKTMVVEKGLKLKTGPGNPKINILQKPKPTRPITIKRNNTITKGQSSNIILVSDERNNLAGVLTKVRLVTPPPLHNALVTPPPLHNALVTPPPLHNALGTPPALHNALVTPPPLHNALVTPPPLHNALVNPPPLKPISKTSNEPRPKIVIQNNKLLNAPIQLSKPKTYIVKIQPQDNLKIQPQDNLKINNVTLLKRKLPIPASANNKRSLLKIKNN